MLSLHCALTGAFLHCVPYTFTMETQYVLISREQVQRMITLLERSEGYCRHARPVTYPMSQEDLYADATEFYSGASGYAGATMRDVLQTLESSLLD